MTESTNEQAMRDWLQKQEEDKRALLQKARSFGIVWNQEADPDMDDLEDQVWDTEAIIRARAAGIPEDQYKALRRDFEGLLMEDHLLDDYLEEKGLTEDFIEWAIKKEYKEESK